MNYETAANKLGARVSRKLANNTYLQKRQEGEWPAGYAVRLHDTDVLTFWPDHVVVNSGGWRTSTTKNRINDYIPGRGIYQQKGLWYFNDGSLYTDGARVTYDGVLLDRVDPTQAEKNFRAIKRGIKAYVKGFCDHILAGKLTRPDNGDCWFCRMRDQVTGKTLGDLGSNHEHLREHMRESYFVPSLLWNAIETKGYTNPAVVWQMIESDAKRGNSFHATARILRDYLTKRLAA